MMFNLNESNRIAKSQHPTDMRMGVNYLSRQVRMVGLDLSNGDIHIFVGKSRLVMKILRWEYGRYVVNCKPPGCIASSAEVMSVRICGPHL